MDHHNLIREEPPLIISAVNRKVGGVALLLSSYWQIDVWRPTYGVILVVQNDHDDWSPLFLLPSISYWFLISWKKTCWSYPLRVVRPVWFTSQRKVLHFLVVFCNSLTKTFFAWMSNFIEFNLASLDIVRQFCFAIHFASAVFSSFSDKYASDTLLVLVHDEKDEHEVSSIWPSYLLLLHCMSWIFLGVSFPWINSQISEKKWGLALVALLMKVMK